jgi:hypothetical protein
VRCTGHIQSFAAHTQQHMGRPMDRAGRQIG